MFNLKNLINTWDRIMVAITFAEAGERETALDLMGYTPLKRKPKRTKLKVKRKEDIRTDVRL